MAHSTEQPLSIIRSQIQARSFRDATLRFLESILVSKDVKSLIEVRSRLAQLLRSEYPSVILWIAEKTVHEKLLVLEFFVRAFALVGDTESCLALRYEALVMRELKSSSCRWLRVSPVEWLNFVEDTLNNGFHAVTEKVQAAEYLKRKTTELSNSDLPCKEKRCLASTSFINGIKRLNRRKLYEHQSILQINDELDGRHPHLI